MRSECSSVILPAPEKMTRRIALRGIAWLWAAGAFGRANAPKPGCQANAWDLDPDHFDLLLTAIREMKQLGFEGFETNIRFIQPQLHRVSEAKAQIDAFGLEFIGAHTSLPQYDKLGLDSAAERISMLAGQAKRFGAQALVVSHKLPPASNLSETLDKKAKMLDMAGERCLRAGLTLAYHNHEPEFEDNAAEETGLLKRTDPRFVSLMLDIGHAWRAYPNAVSFFEEHQARVFGLHVRDYHNGESVPLGQGEFPLRDLAASIERTGWHGWLIDEEERPKLKRKPGTAATGPSRRTMRRIFGV